MCVVILCVAADMLLRSGLEVISVFPVDND